VRHYSTEEGWGILDSDDTPGGCLVRVLDIHTPSGTSYLLEKMSTLSGNLRLLECRKICSDRLRSLFVRLRLLSNILPLPMTAPDSAWLMDVEGVVASPR
jgi:hypothetical protein